MAHERVAHERVAYRQIGRTAVQSAARKHVHGVTSTRSARMALERATAMRRVSDDPLPAPLSTSSSSSSSSVVRYKATLDPNFFLVGERCVPR